MSLPGVVITDKGETLVLFIPHCKHTSSKEWTFVNFGELLEDLNGTPKSFKRTVTASSALKGKSVRANVFTSHRQLLHF